MTSEKRATASEKQASAFGPVAPKVTDPLRRREKRPSAATRGQVARVLRDRDDDDAEE